MIISEKYIVNKIFVSKIFLLVYKKCITAKVTVNTAESAYFEVIRIKKDFELSEYLEKES